jgi:TonB family protein
MTRRAPRSAEAVFLVVALIAHGGIALGLLRAHSSAKRGPDFVELAINTPRPPSLTPPEPARAEPPPRRIVRPKAAPKTMALPPPNEMPKEPPRTAPPPVFGVTMDSTAPGASFSVPVGNTTMIDPGTKRGAAIPSARAAAAEVAKPRAMAEPSIKTLPDIDADVCGRSIVYPHEAEQLGIEGDVKLRVALDERGRVERIDVLSGPGHGLEAVAVDALKHRCKFTPAIASDGRPVRFVISAYTFHFEVPR